MDLLPRMDPEVAAVYPLLPPLDLDDIPTARTTMMDMLAAATAGIAPSATVAKEDHMVPGLDGDPEVRVRHYRPVDQADVLPCLYWIHGGGHVLGQIEQDDLVMEHIVDAVGCAVVSVEWRRAPEHPFPAPMNDCYAGLQWTHKNAAELRIDPHRIAVGGASSGGGSAAGLALLARDRGEVAGVLPAAGLPDAGRPQRHARQPGDHRPEGLEPQVQPDRVAGLRRGCGRHRRGVAVRRPDQGDRPVRAAAGWIPCGDIDLFIDEDIEYAQRLLQAGVPAELHVYPGGIHGFDLLAPGSGLARRFAAERDDVLRRAFAAG